jgi:hypothetical protein
MARHHHPTQVPLPPQFVSRFSGKIVSFIGYEANTVMLKDGVEEIGKLLHNTLLVAYI